MLSGSQNIQCQVFSYILYMSLKKSSRFVRHECSFLNPCYESLMMAFFSRYSTVLSFITDSMNFPTTEVELIGL